MASVSLTQLLVALATLLFALSYAPDAPGWPSMHMWVARIVQRLQETNLWAVASALLLVAVLLKLYRLLFHPLVIRKELEDLQPEPGERRVGAVPPPYPNAWFRVLSSHEVPRGEVRYRQMAGRHLAVFRGHDNRVSVLDAYCPHLGANLGVMARVVDNCLECPFHGWKFDRAGQCVSIPYSTGSIPPSASVTSYPCLELNGAILVYFHAEMCAPTWQPPSLIPKHAVFHGCSRHVLRAHVSETAENGPDVAHLGVLHAPFLIRALRWLLQHRWAATWRAGSGADAHRAFIGVRHSVALLGREVPLSVTHVEIHQVGPGFVCLRFPVPLLGNVYLCEYISPLQPMLTEAVHLAFADRLVPRGVAKLLLAGTVAQFERDIWIWNNKCYQAQPCLVKGDGPIAAFRRWYRQFYTPVQLAEHEYAGARRAADPLPPPPPPIPLAADAAAAASRSDAAGAVGAAAAVEADATCVASDGAACAVTAAAAASLAARSLAGSVKASRLEW